MPLNVERRIVVLAWERDVHAYLERTLLPVNRILCVATDTELLHRVTRGEAQLAVLQLDLAHARVVCDVTAALRQRRPWLPIALYARATPELSHCVGDAFRAGANELLLHGDPSAPRVVSALLDRSLKRSAATYVWEALAPDVPSGLRTMLRRSLDLLDDGINVSALARALGVSKRTLTAQCDRAGWPPPGIIIAWCRVLVATYLLEAGSLTVKQTADTVGLPSAPALRELYFRLAAMTPSAARAAGLSTLIIAFANRIAAHPPTSRQRGGRRPSYRDATGAPRRRGLLHQPGRVGHRVAHPG